MATPLTKIEVYNMALDIVDAQAAASTVDDTGPVRWLNRNWQHTVRSLLRANLWSFAIEFKTINADVWTADTRWLYRYTMPADSLRLIPPTYLGKRQNPPIAYELKRNKIFTNHSPYYGDFVLDLQEPGEWDDLFAEAVAAQLAMGLAHKYTRKNSYVDKAKARLDEALQLAETIGAFEAGIEQAEQHDIIRARSRSA